jgi:hypothetical protein
MITLLRYARQAVVVLFFALTSLACEKTAPVSDVPEPEPAAQQAATPTNDGPFVVNQDFPAHYAAGAENAVSTTMDYKGSEPVTALALQVKLPLGWQFGTILEGAKPAVTPKPDATETVTMVWIQAPAFPATLRYTVKVPDWAEGTHTMEAQAIYRTLGGELRSGLDQVQSVHSP